MRKKVEKEPKVPAKRIPTSAMNPLIEAMNWVVAAPHGIPRLLGVGTDGMGRFYIKQYELGRVVLETKFKGSRRFGALSVGLDEELEEAPSEQKES